jgi:hypothetical protein
VDKKEIVENGSQ